MTEKEYGQLTNHSEEMVDAYVQGRMLPEEQEVFETYILDKPALLEELEIAMLMREGLKADAEQVSRAPAAAVYSWRLAAAAILSIGVGALLGYSIKSNSGDQQIMAANQLVDSQIVSLSFTRSELAPATRIVIRPNAGIVVLRVPLPEPQSLPYRVSLMTAAGDIGKPMLVRPDGAGILNVALAAESLTLGRYEIVVSPDDRPDALLPPLAIEIVRP